MNETTKDLWKLEETDETSLSIFSENKTKDSVSPGSTKQTEAEKNQKLVASVLAQQFKDDCEITEDSLYDSQEKYQDSRLNLQQKTVETTPDVKIDQTYKRVKHQATHNDYCSVKKKMFRVRILNYKKESRKNPLQSIKRIKLLIGKKDKIEKVSYFKFKSFRMLSRVEKNLLRTENSFEVHYEQCKNGNEFLGVEDKKFENYEVKSETKESSLTKSPFVHASQFQYVSGTPSSEKSSHLVVTSCRAQYTSTLTDHRKTIVQRENSQMATPEVNSSLAKNLQSSSIVSSTDDEWARFQSFMDLYNESSGKINRDRTPNLPKDMANLVPSVSKAQYTQTILNPPNTIAQLGNSPIYTMVANPSCSPVNNLQPFFDNSSKNVWTRFKLHMSSSNESSEKTMADETGNISSKLIRPDGFSNKSSDIIIMGKSSDGNTINESCDKTDILNESYDSILTDDICNKSPNGISIDELFEKINADYNRTLNAETTEPVYLRSQHLAKPTNDFTRAETSAIPGSHSFQYLEAASKYCINPEATGNLETDESACRGSILKHVIQSRINSRSKRLVYDEKIEIVRAWVIEIIRDLDLVLKDKILEGKYETDLETKKQYIEEAFGIQIKLDEQFTNLDDLEKIPNETNQMQTVTNVNKKQQKKKISLKTFKKVKNFSSLFHHLYKCNGSEYTNSPHTSILKQINLGQYLQNYLDYLRQKEERFRESEALERIVKDNVEEFYSSLEEGQSAIESKVPLPQNETLEEWQNYVSNLDDALQENFDILESVTIPAFSVIFPLMKYLSQYLKRTVMLHCFLEKERSDVFPKNLYSSKI